MPIELECEIPLTNPSKHSEYARSFRSKIRSIREIAKANIEKARNRQRRQNDERSKTWRPFTVGQAVWLKKPETWKFGPKWIGPFEIRQRMGVNYKIRSKVGKVSVVHHDNLKISQIPIGNGQVVPQTPESGDIRVVQNEPERHNDEIGEVVRHIQPRLVCGKMSGRLFGMVTTKMFQPKQNLLRYKFSRAKNKKRGMVKHVNKIAIYWC